MWKLLVSFYVLYFLEKTRPQNGGSCQPGKWDAACLGCNPESHPTQNLSIYHVPSLFHRAHWTYNSMCLPGNIGFVIKKWSLETPINQMSSHSMHRTMPGTGLQEEKMDEEEEEKKQRTPLSLRSLQSMWCRQGWGQSPLLRNAHVATIN